MGEIKYDERGGILNLAENLAVKNIEKDRETPVAYNFLENFLFKHVRKFNYLLDDAGQYRCRAQAAPSVIRIGPTNRCTGRCFYCPREYIHDKGTGYMDFALYEKIIAEAKRAGVGTISFVLFGEPLLHPRIFDMLELAAQAGCKLRISTNAIVMDQARAEKLLAYLFDSIEMSLDGWTRAEYQLGKQVDKYDEAKNNILYLSKKAKEKKSQITFNIHFVDIGNVGFISKIRYVRFWKKELAGLKHLTSFYYEPHNWAGTRKDAGLGLGLIGRWLNKWELKRPCLYIKGLNINWNGDAYVCTNDPTGKAVIGNFNDSGLKEIYMSEQRAKCLHAHEIGDFRDLNCAVCNVNSIRPLAVLQKRIINALVGLFS